jgi:hypothetical protein
MLDETFEEDDMQVDAESLRRAPKLFANDALLHFSPEEMVMTFLFENPAAGEGAPAEVQAVVVMSPLKAAILAEMIIESLDEIRESIEDDTDDDGFEDLFDEDEDEDDDEGE